MGKGGAMISTNTPYHNVLQRKTYFKRFGKILIDRKVIDKNQLDHALSIQREDDCTDLAGQILMRLGYINEDHVTEVLSSQYRLPFISLKNISINKKILKEIPFCLASKHLFIPIDKISNVLSVAMADPQDFEAIRKICALTLCRVCVLVATPTDIVQAIDKYYERDVNKYLERLLVVKKEIV